MKKTIITFALCSLLLAPCHPAHTQQEKKVARIGLLSSASESLAGAQHNFGPFREGLRELGYVEGKNIFFEFRGAGGDPHRLREFALELVRTRVDLIVVTGNRAIAAAKAATSTIPIIVLGAGDLVGTGMVSSLARPGGNITGPHACPRSLVGSASNCSKSPYLHFPAWVLSWRPARIKRNSKRWRVRLVS